MRIFLTVGSMLPFDRLVHAMDAWAGANRHAEVFAQIGDSDLRPEHIDYRHFISPADFRGHFAASDVVVSHVGMGTVITAFESNKPLVMLPRRPELGEVTSNHQLATARWLAGRPGMRIIDDERSLPSALSIEAPTIGAAYIETGTKAALVNALRQFIAD